MESGGNNEGSDGRTILISAGESSGDLYGARLIEALRRRQPGLVFSGCAGPRMRLAGVEPIVRAESLSVVGLVEVLHHIPRIYGEFRRLVRFAATQKPALAILVDSPDFHLRLAKKLKKLGIPILYLVAPQAWAWRRGRVRQLRRDLEHLYCIFPFEESFFRKSGVPATYVGHPLAAAIGRSLSREDFFRKHDIDTNRPVVVLLPGSRRGEIARHLPPLLDAVKLLGPGRATFVVAAPFGFSSSNPGFFRDRIGSGSAGRAQPKVIEGETWDAIGHADLALAASGTVTIETALLGTPMVTFYRVTRASWLLGKLLVTVPFYSMVNLVAGRRIVPELIQDDMTGGRIAQEAERLLADAGARARMRAELAEVAAMLSGTGDAIERASELVDIFLRSRGVASAGAGRKSGRGRQVC
ncbi:MAG: lipid-A-disaccharide synthase [Acidobacteria bacterium]|nr:lipid-A-disaccharide synthase [Acidobacteriota bacterium]